MLLAHKGLKVLQRACIRPTPAQWHATAHVTHIHPLTSSNTQGPSTSGAVSRGKKCALNSYNCVLYKEKLQGSRHPSDKLPLGLLLQWYVFLPFPDLPQCCLCHGLNGYG